MDAMGAMDIVSSWQSDNNFFYYITPSSQLIGGSATNKKAAGSLRCGEGQNLDDKDSSYDFLRYDVRTLKRHTKAHIAKRVGRLKDETIKNESGVRYVYGDPITDMLVDAFGFKLQLEESVDESQDTAVSVGSRTDYCCWKLYKSSDRRGETQVCVAVLETKHNPIYHQQLRNIAQVLGYYCSNRTSDNKTGIAMLLNEYNDQVEFTFFLFPYYSKQKQAFSVQSLMFPKVVWRKNDILRNPAFISLIFLLVMDEGDQNLELSCPEEMIFHNEIVGLFTQAEIEEQEREEFKKRFNELSEEIVKKNAEIVKLQQRIQEFEDLFGTVKKPKH